MISYLRLTAPNDLYGNPRRVYVLFRDGKTIATMDEGYSGVSPLLKKYPKAVDLGSFQTTIRQYLDLLKFNGLE